MLRRNIIPALLWLTLLTTLGLLNVGVARAQDQEVIHLLAQEARLDAEGLLTIHETLEFTATGASIQHGIFRDFLLASPGFHPKHRHQLELLSINLDGRDMPLAGAGPTYEDNGRRAQLRLGDPDNVLSRGRHTLTLVYTLTDMVVGYEDHDELYYNATGSDWQFPIEEARFSLSLPDKAPGEDITGTDWYTGRPEEGKTVPTEVGDDYAMTTGPLQPGQGLTVVYAWPRGLTKSVPFFAGMAELIEQEKWHQRLMALIPPLLLLAFYLFAWFKVGRDPAPDTVMPLFHPPAGMSPGYARLLANKKWDYTCFTANILALATGGHLTVTAKDDEQQALTRKPQTSAPVDPGEQQLLADLFMGNNNQLNLKSTKAAGPLQLAYNKQKNFHEAAFQKDYRPNVGWWLAGGGALALYLVLGWFWDQLGLGIGMAVLAVVMSVIPLFVFIPLRGRPNASFGKWFGLLVRLVIMGGAALIFSVILFAGFDFNPLAIASPYAVAALALIFYWLMPAPTADGVKNWAQMAGYRMFLGTAEKGRLEFFNPPELTPTLFEEGLPYALALDQADTWGQTFEQILSQASYQPAWTNDRQFRAGSLNNWHRGFARGMRRASVPPAAPGTRSGGHSSGGFGGRSGMGGGGSSGGGRGGGGGGGW